MNNCLILKEKALIRYEDAERLRQRMLREAEDGIVIVPSCFDVVAYPKNMINDIQIEVNE